MRILTGYILNFPSIVNYKPGYPEDKFIGEILLRNHIEPHQCSFSQFGVLTDLDIEALMKAYEKEGGYGSTNNLGFPYTAIIT